MGLRKIIYDGFEDTRAKLGRTFGWASEFHWRANGVGPDGYRPGLGQVVDNYRTDGQKRALSVLSRYADTKEIL